MHLLDDDGKVVRAEKGIIKEAHIIKYVYTN